jgi:hypothetical protein
MPTADPAAQRGALFHTPDGIMFSRPTDAERERLRDDLVHRAELVRTRGWNDYRAVWSTGEVVGVAALLCDNDILGELDETLQSVWARWAGGFWLPCPQLSKVDMANY